MIVALAWIAFSDRAVEALIPDPAARQVAQTAKGGLFVAVTAALLYALISRGQAGLRRVGADLGATIDSMADAVLVVDRHNRIVEANRAALDLLGVASKGDVLLPLEEWGRRFALRYPDGSAIPYERYATLRALGGERITAYDAVIRRADGRVVWVGVSAAPVSGRRGRTGLAVAVLRDVSAARGIERMRDDFLSAAAHEFKTPLAVVKAYAQLVRKRVPSEAEALDVVERQVDRLNRLVEHLLDLSRLEAGGRELRHDRFDLATLAREAVAPLSAHAPSHVVSVVAEGAVPVLGDRERIGRVITSLVENAIRFSPDGGPVETRVASAGGEALVSVADRGLGIPADRQPRVFQRYYRAHADRPDDPGGLGVALGLSREIVSRHGGRMWFESEAGRGSVFHFTLPLAAEDA
jgi:PAS domain S-box-containing protein